jgi:hypothetical protein
MSGMRTHKNIIVRNILRAVMLFMLVFLSTSAPGLAATSGAKSTKSSAGSTSSNTVGDAVTHSYSSDSSVQTGMMVELNPKDATSVLPLKQADMAHMLGVVIPASNATIVLTPQNITKQQVLVTNTGHYSVLVTNQNGPIHTGDYLTASAIDGLAMKADQNQAQIVGKAAGNFSGSANVIGSVQLTDSLGHKTNVSIGRIDAEVAVDHNPLYQQNVDYVPGALAKIAVVVAKKPVGAARIYISLAVMLVVAFITANMMYSGIRSGMIAVGRNPLSKKSIIKSLIQTVMAGLIIFVAGVFGVYLLLKL